MNELMEKLDEITLRIISLSSKVDALIKITEGGNE